MKKLTRLTINKFRNVAPTTLEFRPGLNVVLGRNAAGKTTLLRLLSTVLDAPDSSLKDDPFDVSYHVENQSAHIEHNITRTHAANPQLPFRVAQLSQDEASALQQTDTFIVTTGDETIKVEVTPNEVAITQGESQRRVARPAYSNPLTSAFTVLFFNETTRNLSLDLMASNIKTPGRLDESLERFNALLKLEIQIGHTGIAVSSISIPESLVELIHAGIPEGSLATFSPAFLDRAAKALGYDSIAMHLDIARLTPEPNRQVTRLSNLRFYLKRMGEEVFHDRLSYGQKRLLSFFTYADSSTEIIITDELVNGLHHDWISSCLSEIGERQAFLTSQNPLLLDFLRFDSAEEVRRTFILCEQIGTEAGAQLTWRNPSEDEAESFFLAYQTGIQRVSDILLTKGLW
ncbi:AAA family ATPase [Corallococcus exercitus]|uniref:AAA family ATPase n=1 Tax=Corallococcus exercitus TaxID=2316736 RepID=A0A7Y4NHT8_9BACT|nr:AAA family ATPase [Corallococcus exercitus]NOK15008.1 AAA family ATPase [Corallococcus exercitus]